MINRDTSKVKLMDEIEIQILGRAGDQEDLSLERIREQLAKAVAVMPAPENDPHQPSTPRWKSGFSSFHISPPTAEVNARCTSLRAMAFFICST